MIIVDNYFENIDDIRKLALVVNYFPPLPEDGWRGYRSNKLLYGFNKIVDNIFDRIKETVEERTEKDVFDIDIFFHCSPKVIMENDKNFHQSKYHKDLSYDCAGVVYLTPNARIDGGTCILDVSEGTKFVVENHYNRFLAYPADMFHGPHHLFGTDKETTRMTITFFCRLRDKSTKKLRNK